MSKVQKINPNQLAEEILKNEKIITFQDTQEMYAYNPETGLYENCEKRIEGLIQEELELECSTFTVNETLHSIQRQTYTKREIIGQDCNLIPLANGIYNFETNFLI